MQAYAYVARLCHWQSDLRCPNFTRVLQSVVDAAWVQLGKNRIDFLLQNGDRIEVKSPLMLIPFQASTNPHVQQAGPIPTCVLLATLSMLTCPQASKLSCTHRSLTLCVLDPQAPAV